ncbi:MAG: hypothetical protein QOJ88_1248, partial [Pyrinomonadaceae bacterium]|nr:hypothetical protein [Pyrinomonadaceae bacterium]
LAATTLLTTTLVFFSLVCHFEFLPVFEVN